MTHKEAIENLKGCIISEEYENGKPNGNITCDLTREILEMAISALKKQVPKKPKKIYEKEGQISHGVCPACGCFTFDIANYCHGCGQAIDWTETADDESMFEQEG